MNIMVICNNRNINTYTGVLVGYGHQVSDVKSFDAARTMLKSNMIPELIMIDVSNLTVQMKEFVEFVRFEQRLLTVGMIVIGTTEREAAYAEAYGANRFLYRPVELTDLLAIIHQTA